MAERARLIGPVAASGSQRVGWDRAGRTAVTLDDGNRLVGLTAAGESWNVAARAEANLSWSVLDPLLGILGASLFFASEGRVRVHPNGADLFLSPDGSRIAAHLAGRRVEVTTADGAVVDRFEAEHVMWHPTRGDLLYADAVGLAWRRSAQRVAIVDDSGERGSLLARTSHAGSRIVVWGRYGPFDVLSEAGDLELSFPAHLGDANLAAALGTTVLVTSGDDGRVAIHDLVRGATHLSRNIGGLAVGIDLDPTDRFACVELLDGGVVIVDIEAGDMIETAHAIRHARWSPHERTLACTDGSEMWLQVDFVDPDAS